MNRNRYLIIFLVFVVSYLRIHRELVPKFLFGFFVGGSKVFRILGYGGMGSAGGAVPHLHNRDRIIRHGGRSLFCKTQFFKILLTWTCGASMHHAAP